MNTHNLIDTARTLIAGDKGLLAMDESNPTCWRHSKLCIIEPGATGLRAVANTMPRWKKTWA